MAECSCANDPRLACSACPSLPRTPSVTRRCTCGHPGPNGVCDGYGDCPPANLRVATKAKVSLNHAVDVTKTRTRIREDIIKQDAFMAGYELRKSESYPECGCPPERYDGHVCEEEIDPFTADFPLCDDDGIVRSGVMHKGTDYDCTGHAHWGGQHIRCTSSAHARHHNEFLAQSDEVYASIPERFVSSVCLACLTTADGCPTHRGQAAPWFPGPIRFESYCQSHPGGCPVEIRNEISDKTQPFSLPVPQPLQDLADAVTAEQSAKTHALAQLRQQIWEASQFMGTGELVEYFNAVLDEIDLDAP